MLSWARTWHVVGEQDGAGEGEARQQPQKECEGDDEHARREGEELRLEHDEKDAAEGGNGEGCQVGTLFTCD